MASLLVTHTSHFVRGADGHVYSPEILTAYSFWGRYLAAFDQVGVAARVRSLEVVPRDLPRADGSRVVFHDLPDYTGPWQYLVCRRALSQCLRAAAQQYDGFCLRVPCAIATLLWRELCRAGRPFAVEVVGDPQDSLGAGSVRSIVRPLACWSAVRALRAQCRDALATAYVTRESLQRRYPPSAGRYTTHYSSLELPPEAVVDHPRGDFTVARRLVFVGTLAVLYKAPDVLLHALALCRRSDLRLTVVGSGRMQSSLEELATSLGIAEQVTFLGTVAPGEPVRRVLDANDLFVLPSRQEGLPRAMIEAMARGLPCIGSSVGGIPELLPPEDRVRPGDPVALSAKIVEFVDDPKRMRAAGARNRETALQYVLPHLVTRRTEFYGHLLDVRGASSSVEQRA